MAYLHYNLLIITKMCDKIFIVNGGDGCNMNKLTAIYLIGAVGLLAIAYFLLMRSVNKNLENIKSKSKKRKR